MDVVVHLVTVFVNIVGDYFIGIKTKNITTSYQNSPSQISGLTAAICILKWLSKGYSQDQIVYSKFEGNRRLVSLWIAFLKDNHWIKEQEKEKKGKRTLIF